MGSGHTHLSIVKQTMSRCKTGTNSQGKMSTQNTSYTGAVCMHNRSWNACYKSYGTHPSQYPSYRVPKHVLSHAVRYEVHSQNIDPCPARPRKWFESAHVQRHAWCLPLELVSLSLNCSFVLHCRCRCHRYLVKATWSIYLF